MAEVRSRLSSKGQTVIPKPVRERLGLRAGDTVRFRYAEKGAVTLEKVQPEDDDPFVAFEEWASPEDEQLYRDL